MRKTISLLKATRNTLVSKKLPAIIFVSAFVVAGVSALLISRASTFQAGVEAESGTKTANAKRIIDSRRAGGAYVQFTAPVSSCSTFSAPTTITAGGTYTGCWQTTDGTTPAIRIATTQPVTIKDSTVRGNTVLIIDAVSGVNLTVQNTNLIGVTPGPNITDTRRAIRLGRGAANLKAENNYFENNAGIKVTGWANAGSGSNTITVLRNKVKNITNKNIKSTSNDLLVQFFQMGQIHQISNVEIAWNEVINNYQESRVEDNINLYQSGGVATSHIRIHDNFIWGGFPEDYTATFYRGGGIIAGDSSHNLNVGWVDIYNNQVVGTTNYGVSIVCGHDSSAYNNKVISSGRTATNNLFVTANVGLSGNSATAWNGRCDYGNYDNNVFRDNVVGWMNHQNRRSDMTFRCGESNSPPAPASEAVQIECAANINNTSVQPADSPITYDMERAEFTQWQLKLATNRIKIGVQ